MAKRKKVGDEKNPTAQNAEKDSSKKSASSDESSKDATPAIIDQEQREKILRRFLIPLLRRGTYRWPERRAALVACRKERGKYECQGCKALFKEHELKMDHIHPVVAPRLGFIDWNNYIERMFVFQEGWQPLCKDCHDIKTLAEDSIRQVHTRKKN